MALYLGDAAKAQLACEPKGCYLGHGGVWVETTNTTSKLKTSAVAANQKIVKVPSIETQQLLLHGIERFELKGNAIEASVNGFKATLPVTAADQFEPDIKIIDHVSIAAELAVDLIDLLRSARHFVAPQATNSAYRFVYVAERRVFATDGYSLFSGLLKRHVEKRMIFSQQACLDLARLWTNAVPSVAMQSERGLLLKNTQMATAVRCVDGVVPTELYRVVRGDGVKDLNVSLSLDEFRDAVNCVAVANGERDSHCTLEIVNDKVKLRSRFASSESQLIGVAHANHRSFVIDLKQLCRCLKVLKGDAVTVGQLGALKSNLAFVCAAQRIVVTMSVKEERR